MQDVSFFVIDKIAANWKMVISIIEDAGYEVVNDIVPSNINVIISGSYVNPFVIDGKKILLTHPDEWLGLWDVVYEPVMEEYYDSVVNVGSIKPEMLMDVIRGEIEATESRSKD